MSAIWTPKRPEIATGQILVSAPVTSSHWENAAHLANFLRGKGGSLVPTCMPNFQMEDGEGYIFRFWTRTRSAAVQRIWVLSIKTVSGTAVASVRAPHTTGTLRSYGLTGARNLLVYVENLTEKGIADDEISIEVAVPEGQTFQLETISCFEQDRPVLTLDSVDYGVSVASTQVGQPIYDIANLSVGGIVDALDNADARRCSLLQWSVGSSLLGSGGFSRTSLTYADILPLPLPILGAKQYRTDTTSRAVWRVYGKQAAGTGYVRLTTTNSGVDDTLPINWSTDAWSLPRVIEVDAEDLEKSDGRRGVAWDEMQVEYAGDGTNAVNVKSVSVYTGADVIDLFDYGDGTFSRASDGTYYYSSAAVSSSFLDYLAADNKRLDSREDGLGTTLLLEPEGNTNHVTYSTDLGNWTMVNGASVDADKFYSPHALELTDVINFPAGGTNVSTTPQIQIELPTIPNSSVDCTISFWAKMETGTGKIGARLLRRDGVTFSGALPYEFDLTDTWQRFSTSQWAGNAGASPLKLCLLNGTDYASRAVQVWGVQVEDGISSTPIQNPSSYIPTDSGSSVTRAPDSLVYATGEYPESFLTRGFALTHIPTESSTDMLERNNGTGWTGVIIGIGSANHYLRFYNNAGLLYIHAYSTPLVRITAGPLTFSAGQPLGIEVRPNEGTIRILGATTGNGTYGDTNILPAADAMTWTGTGTPGLFVSGQADPYGGTDAWLLTDDNNAALESVRTATGVTAGGPLRVGLRFKKDPAATAFVGVRFAVEGSEVALNLVTGAAQVIAGAGISNISVTEDPVGWWHLQYDHTGEAAGNVAIRVHPARGTTYPTASNAAMGSCTVYGGSLTVGLPFSWPSGGSFGIAKRVSGTTLGNNGRWYRYIVGL